MYTRPRISFLILFGALAIGLSLLLYVRGLAESTRQGTEQGAQTLDLPPIDSFDHLFIETQPESTERLPLRGFAPRPVYPPDYVLNVSVNKGCGNVYYAGEKIISTVHVPEPGTLTVWSSADGSWWRQVIGPTWATPSYPVSRYGRIETALGPQLIYARLDSPDGRVVEGLCHFTSIDYLSLPMATPSTSPPPNEALGCSAVHPREVSPGQSFNIRVRVQNSGGAPVDRATLFARIDPPGFFGLESCDPPCFLLYPGTETALEAIHPNQPQYVDLSVRAPNVTGYFTYQFLLSSSGAPKDVCTTTTVNVQGTGYLGTDSELEDSAPLEPESAPSSGASLAIPLPDLDLVGRLVTPATEPESSEDSDESFVVPP